MLTLYLYADLCDAVDEFVPHEVIDADGCAFAFLQKDGHVLSLVLVDVDAASQRIAFGISQRITNRIAAAGFWIIAQLFYGKH